VPLSTGDAASLMYVAVRDALRAGGVDIHSHPYSDLDQASRDVWIDAWSILQTSLTEAGCIVADYQSLRRTIDASDMATHWKNLPEG
jgi:hypothetical protein